jgi:hypothetical protein
MVVRVLETHQTSVVILWRFSEARDRIAASVCCASKKALGTEKRCKLQDR